jgi:glycerophosphoryl diester phosphodiesterase
MTPLPDAFRRVPLAHRALHDRDAGVIENSPTAIDRAVAAGYGIEIDLQLSADGVPMVFHDDTLDRLTAATGRVRAREAAELCTLALTGGSDRIPTLADVLDQVAGQVPLLIELKTQDPDDGALEAATAALLQGYAGPVAAMSFHPGMVARMAALAPGVPRGLTTGSWDESYGQPAAVRDHLRAILDATAVGASFISHEAADLGRPRVAELKAEGLAVLCWTIRSPEAEAAARRIADNVTFEGYAAALP